MFVVYIFWIAVSLVVTVTANSVDCVGKLVSKMMHYSVQFLYVA